MNPARALTWSDLAKDDERAIRRDWQTYMDGPMPGDENIDRRDHSEPPDELAERHYQMCAALIELLCAETLRLTTLFLAEPDFDASERMLSRLRWLDACQYQARQDMRQGIYSDAGRREEDDADATTV